MLKADFSQLSDNLHPYSSMPNDDPAVRYIILMTPILKCRCMCPPFDVPNVARMGGKIYTGQVDKAQDCSCMNIVLPSIPDLKATNFKLMEEQVCPTCRCLYQR